LRRTIGYLLLGATVFLVVLVVHLDITIRDRFEGQRWALPAHVFTRAMELHPGAPVNRDRLLVELRTLGYRDAGSADSPGSYALDGETVSVHTRGFGFWEGDQPPVRVSVRFQGGAVAAVETAAGQAADLVRLEPRLFASISPTHYEDRILVGLDGVPPELVALLLAVEDRDFTRHIGVDISAIVRAGLANLRARRAVQGGSTLTQQLVKNLYLTSERTFRRKAVEAIMALLLEYHYEKEEILEAYLNEVFLAQDGARSIHGFGLASWHYFARPLSELGIAELALLVGIVRGPSYYNPRTRPERAQIRRERVLDVALELQLITPDAHAEASASPLGVVSRPASAQSVYPAFLDVVRRQLRRDYREEDLRSEGLRIFTTLDPFHQEILQSVLAERLPTLESVPGVLQGAGVVALPDSGEVLAVVGGRESLAGGYNRAIDAYRPIGSLIKPVVLAAAVESRAATLATRLDDGPLVVSQAGSPDWEPSNYDDEYHGEVTALEALARSYNIATVRMGLSAGVPAVADALRRLGADSRVPEVPALLLGAVDLSPLEVAQIYQGLFNGGFRAPLRTIQAVLTREGEPLRRYPLEVDTVLDPEAAYLAHYAMQAATRIGTARGLGAAFPARADIAGKTGTTGEYRDSWFAGGLGELMAVVWIGRDDNQPAGLSGARGAMSVWQELMLRASPRPLPPNVPPGIEWAAIDPHSGLLAEGCEVAWEFPFVAGTVPQGLAPCADAGVRDTVRGGAPGDTVRSWMDRWLRR